MKNIKPYIIALTVAFTTMSCEDKLTTKPTTEIADSEVYKTTANIQTVINGTWRYLNDTYFTYANPGYSTVMRTSDAMANDVAVTTKYGYRDPYAFTDLSNKASTRVRAIWTLLYKVIDNSNNVIAKTQAAEGSQEDKNRLIGQAKTLRAFSYLTLASYYQHSYLRDKNALAVPVYTEPSSTTTVGKAKSSLEDIYTLILADLNEASTLLANYYRPATDKFKINENVAQGLLARAYLNIGDWDKAATAAKKAREGYALMTPNSYLEGFNDLQNEEWIWGHKQTTDQSIASYTFHYLDVSSAASYYYSFMADPYFKEHFDNSDIRTSLFEWDSSVGREGFLRYKKFKFRPNLTGDIVYMRAAEMYLIEAEANARFGNTQPAITALNTLRAARQATLYTANQPNSSLLEEILLERRKELWGEGFGLSDIIRNQDKVERKEFKNADGSPLLIDITNANGVSKKVPGQGHRVTKFPDGSSFTENSNYYLFSIPQEESLQNPNL